MLVHHGPRSSNSLILLDKQPLAPGGTALAQLRLDRAMPLGALPGDRFILRGFVASTTGGSTIAGGRVIRVLAPKARKGEPHALAVAALAGSRLDQRIALDVATASAAGLALDEIGRRVGLPAVGLADPIARLVAAGELLVAGDHHVHATTVAELEQRVVTVLGAALGDPDGVSREALRAKLPAALPPRIYDAILAGLERRGKLVAAGDRVRSASAPARGALSATEAAVLAKLVETGIEPPRPKDPAGLVGVAEPQLKAALDRLVAAKLAVKVKPDLVMDAATVDGIRARLVAFLAAHATIDAQQWKELTGASRKFTIPLAEYFDGEKLTLRVGDLRRRR